jgi:hypothetical protein
MSNPTYTSFRHFIGQAPFLFWGSQYDFSHPLELREIEGEPPITGTYWVAQYRKRPIHIRDIWRTPNSLGSTLYTIRICQQTEVSLLGFYILNYGTRSIWFLNYRRRCHHECSHPGLRTDVTRQVFFVGPVCPAIQFEVVDPITQEPSGPLYQLQLDLVTLGGRDREVNLALQSQILSEMTMLYYRAMQRFKPILVEPRVTMQYSNVARDSEDSKATDVTAVPC